MKVRDVPSPMTESCSPLDGIVFLITPGSIAVAVIYLTLQVSGLSVAQMGLLPVLPLGGLLLMIVVGYFLMFRMASGQTLGRMAMDRSAHTRAVRL